MNILGFYKVCGSVNFKDFVLQNLAGLCDDLFPGNTVQFLSSKRPLGNNVVAYIPQGTNAQLESGESVFLKNVFVFFEDRLHQLIHGKKARHNAILLWQIIFHEFRHFVQMQTPLKESDLLDMVTLEQILSLNRDVGANILKRLEAYGYLKEHIRAAELDAYIVEHLAIAHFLVSLEERDDGTFDYEKVKSILLLRVNVTGMVDLAPIRQLRPM